ncbi:GALACTOSE OXIDASE/KELCH REPEAT SUPERFAMILY PROTEIN-RELATED [Salix purpurea]|uniref:GALACTOSE OXIDASE/KELCH REPEAT SUPERFAMILY PROTEIN-RELATED n=1 Tax=Salix purpurea TaxID=77065 RepID=A0A9Q0TH56_SALPP|nr:GALACTOSE OXIDASE/KELCH REPEAT SUPERFAMILY PROTEIN-RELATED [Salix purpurea]
MARLIPSLPNDIATECLIRLPFQHFPAATLACEDWKLEIESPEFFRSRKVSGYSQPIIVMALAKVGGEREGSSRENLRRPVYRLAFCDLKTGKWGELQPIPEFSKGLPIFVSATWRRGADMPGVKRSLFGCASDINGDKVYVAGGHDEEKNALTSVLGYDVAKDEWIRLPDMARERDECNAVFHSGEIHVFGGYSTEAQGVFDAGFEAFDLGEWKWVRKPENFLETNMSAKTCVADGNGRLYICQGGEMMVAYGGVKWRRVADLPVDMSVLASAMIGQKKILVVGSGKSDDPHMLYELDLERCAWAKLEAPKSVFGYGL